MAARTPAYSFVVALGPIKCEIMNIAVVNDTDTVTSKLVRPLFAMATNNTDGAPMTAVINVAVSGKTLTFNSTDLTGDNDELNVLVFGF